MTYLELRKKYLEFHYLRHETNVADGDLILNYYYDIPPDHAFKHTVRIANIPMDLKTNQYENLIFAIGLVEIFSYWKTTASPKITIEAGRLDDFQIKWWHKLLIKGMGQYFFENKIDFTAKNFVEIVSSGKDFGQNPPLKVEGEKILIPVGGGKDSAVTLELLGKTSAAALVVNPTQAALKTIDQSRVGQILKVERIIDPKILELNKKGYLNGHVPFSASLAFIGTLVSSIFGFKYLAFSNERSADEENTEYMGQKINHQYSKTFEFENDFRDYNRKYLSNVEYFSFLRPLYEIQIAKVFSKYEKYFEAIRSCNVGMKENIWCEACPKCLSTFILLSPFLGTERMKRVFSKDLTRDPKLSELLSELIDDDKVKPFECVGTREELKAVLNHSYQKLLNTWGEHNIPDKFVGILNKAINE